MKIDLAKDILSDVLEELQGGESNRPEGVGVTSDEYVICQLFKLWDVLHEREIMAAPVAASYSKKRSVYDG